MDTTTTRSRYQQLVDLLPKPGETETLVIDPSTANTLIANSNFEVQRRLRKNHVRRILDRIQEGEWTSGIQPVAFVFATEEQTVYNVNGQHTLHAIAECEEGVRMDVRSFEGSDREYAGKIFSFFDRQQRRSSKDNIQAFGLDEESGLSQTKLGHISAAVKFIRGGFTKPDAPGLRMEDHVNDVRDWMLWGKDFYETTADVPREVKDCLHRSPVLAVGLVTFRYAQTLAEKFWYQTAWIDRIAMNDPRHTLHDWLLRYNLTGGSDTEGPQISKAKMARGVERAWKYFYEGGAEARLKVIKAGNNNRELRLKGTPWDPDEDTEKPRFHVK
jgi:hypothetical protein